MLNGSSIHVNTLLYIELKLKKISHITEKTDQWNTQATQ